MKSTDGLIKRASACFIILFLTSAPVEARRSASELVELTLHPAKVAEPDQTYWLLPGIDKQTDADAVPLYEKAIQSMPKGINRKQIQEWLKLPLNQLPQNQVEQVIQKHIESLRLVAKASRCKQCNWPEVEPGTEMPGLSVYRELTFVIRLWARLEISQGQYKGALVAMRTSFGMAKHLGQAPTIIQTLVGAAVAGVMCRELEEFVQEKDSPNLHAALANLPEPLVHIEKAIESEKANLKKYNILTRKVMEKQLESAHDRTRLIAKRLDNHLNALQVVEAIRHYVATHDGQLPQALGDITDMKIPNDLMSGKAFEYSRTATGAILKSAIPEAGNEKDAVHYEIVLKK
jgi:hypothetical protein